MIQELVTLNQQLNEAQTRLKTLETEVVIYREELSNSEAAEVQARQEKVDIKTLSRIKGETLSARELVAEAEAAIKATKEKIQLLTPKYRITSLKNQAVTIAQSANVAVTKAEEHFAAVANVVMEHLEDLRVAREEMKKLAIFRDEFIEVLFSLEQLTGEKIVHSPYPNHFIDNLEKHENLDSVLAPWVGSKAVTKEIQRIKDIPHTTPIGFYIQMLAVNLEKKGLLSETYRQGETHEGKVK